MEGEWTAKGDGGSDDAALELSEELCEEGLKMRMMCFILKLLLLVNSACPVSTGEVTSRENISDESSVRDSFSRQKEEEPC